MAKLSREEFLKLQEQNTQQRQDYQTQQRSRVSYFGLKDDGDEAIIRIASDPEDFEVYTVHPVTIDGKFRKVNCINDINEGVHSCPLCEAGIPLQNRFYIRLIEYVRDEQGNIVPEAKIWERPTSYIQRLVNLYTEYGSLKDNIFKVKRNGARGDMKTDYVFMFANPSIYNEQLYPKDFSAFDDYTPLGGAILNRTADEMRDMLPKDKGVTFTPQLESAVATADSTVSVSANLSQQPPQPWMTQSQPQQVNIEQTQLRNPVMYQ